MGEAKIHKEEGKTWNVNPHKIEGTHFRLIDRATSETLHKEKGALH